jgi:hypothetical protein
MLIALGFFFALVFNESPKCVSAAVNPATTQFGNPWRNIAFLAAPKAPPCLNRPNGRSCRERPDVLCSARLAK